MKTVAKKELVKLSVSEINKLMKGKECYVRCFEKFKAEIKVVKVGIFEDLREGGKDIPYFYTEEGFLIPVKFVDWLLIMN